jgi:hypothetical protein
MTCGATDLSKGAGNHCVVSIYSRITGANLSGANLTDVSWGDTTCPDGTNSDNDGFTCSNNL